MIVSLGPAPSTPISADSTGENVNTLQLPLEKAEDKNKLFGSMPLDARVGAKMGYDHYIIVSPNANRVPQFPLIEDGQVIVREDGHLGGQTFHRWPQVYSQKHFHLCCIPFDEDSRITNTTLRKQGDIDHIHIYDPDVETDFIPDPQAYDWSPGTEVGLLRKELIDTLNQSFLRVANQCTEKRKKLLTRGMDRDVVLVYNRCFHTCQTVLDRLRCLKTSWRAILLAFRDVQSGIMELQGLCTYFQYVVPRMASCRVSNPVLGVIGAFAINVEDLERLHRLGIPVWYICDARVYTRRVLNVQNYVPWSEYLGKKLMTHGKKVILQGLDCGRSTDLRDGLAGHFMTGESFDLLFDKIYNIRTVTSEVATMGSQVPTPGALSTVVTGPLQAHSTEQHTPNSVSRVLSSKSGVAAKKPDKSKNRKEPSVNYALFLHIPRSHDGEADLPKHHKVVRECLMSIGNLERNFSSPALYPYPPPYLLVHSSDSTQTARSYLNYIRIRKALIKMQEEPGTLDGRNWRRVQQWKTIVRGEYYKSTPLPPGITSPFVEGIYNVLPSEASSSGGKVGKAKKDMSHRFDPINLTDSKRRRIAEKATAKAVMAAEHAQGPFKPEEAQEWRGRLVTVKDIEDHKEIRQEVQYEITENMMRLEFRALDFKIHPRDGMSVEEQQNRDRMISCVFRRDGRPADSLYAGFVADLSGRVEEYWEEIVAEENVQALTCLLSSWPNFPHHETMPDFKSLIAFYIRTFILFFNRIPNMHCSVPKSLLTY